MKRSLLAAALVLPLAACGGSKHSTATRTTSAGGCAQATAPRPKARKEPRPKGLLDSAKTYDVTFETNCGSFTIRLAAKSSPRTAGSFASLVKKGFFDHTVFHRIVPGFVIQGGDPTAKGSGGPGYTTVEPPPSSTRYTLGVAAMAKAASDAPGTAGSQFFIVTAPDA